MDTWKQRLIEMFKKVNTETECGSSFVKFTLPNGEEIQFAREHNGIADFFVIRISGKIVHQG